MMYYGNGMDAGGWVLMILAVALVTLVVVVVVVQPLTGRRSVDRPEAVRAPTDPEQVLADRFARGDIDAQEYEQRLHTLRSAQRQR
jgi:putative membrane protein